MQRFVRAGHERLRFGEANEDYANRSIKVMQFVSTMIPSLSVFVNIGMVIVIWSGGLQAIQGSLTVGQIVAAA